MLAGERVWIKGRRVGDQIVFAFTESRRRGISFQEAVQAASTSADMAEPTCFASWTRLLRHVVAINARTWTHPDAHDTGSPADTLVRLACLTYCDDESRRAEEATVVFAAHPDLSGASLAAAAAGTDNIQLGRLVALHPDAAAAPTGPFGWPALMYLTYSRIGVDREAALESAELLLAAGADRNDGRFFDGPPTPFTVLTGCLAGGERDQPAHPRGMQLARLLLSHGTEPNDAQTLYNRVFRQEDDFLEVLFDFGLGSGDGGVAAARCGRARAGEGR